MNNFRKSAWMGLLLLSLGTQGGCNSIVTTQMESSTTARLNPPKEGTSFNSVFDLRAAPVSNQMKNSMTVRVLGFHAPNDFGGGTFAWDSSSIRLDDGGIYLCPNSLSLPQQGRWVRQYSGPVDPRWFGALGSNTGKTPADTGQSIEKAAFNHWPALALPNGVKDDDLSPQQMKVDPSAKLSPQGTPLRGANPSPNFGWLPPFGDSDSWDTIGLQLALWSFGADPSDSNRSGEVHVPSGSYAVTQPLTWSNFMSVSIFGEGAVQSSIVMKTGFERSLPYPFNSVLLIYRGTAGYRTIRDVNLGAQSEASMGVPGFAIVRAQNGMGWLFQGVHVGGGERGFDLTWNSGDFEIASSLIEFNQIGIHIAAGSAADVHNNEIWTSPRWNSSIVLANQQGVPVSMDSANPQLPGTEKISDACNPSYVPSPSEIKLVCVSGGIGVANYGNVVLSANVLVAHRTAALISAAPTSTGTITGNRFTNLPQPGITGGSIDFGAIIGANHAVTGNTFDTPSGTNGLTLAVSHPADPCTGVAMPGDTLTTVVGNTFHSTGLHPILDLGTSTAVSVSGNTFSFDATTPPPYGGAMVIAGSAALSSWSNGANRCVIANNTFNRSFGVNVNSTNNSISGNTMPAPR